MCSNVKSFPHRNSSVSDGPRYAYTDATVKRRVKPIKQPGPQGFAIRARTRLRLEITEAGIQLDATTWSTADEGGES